MVKNLSLQIYESLVLFRNQAQRRSLLHEAPELFQSERKQKTSKRRGRRRNGEQGKVSLQRIKTYTIEDFCRFLNNIFGTNLQFICFRSLLFSFLLPWHGEPRQIYCRCSGFSAKSIGKVNNGGMRARTTQLPPRKFMPKALMKFINFPSNRLIDLKT